MAREKKPVHKVQMTEGKKNIIRQLLEEYDIESAQDIQDALKDLLGEAIKQMMEAEMDAHLGYSKSERSDSDDYRNGYKTKQVNSSYGSMEIEVPQDRKSTFEPQIVKKRQKDISDIDQKIISMYEISTDLRLQKALFRMLRTRLCLRLKTGRTVRFQKCILFCTLMQSITQSVITVSSGNSQLMLFWVSIMMDTKRC